MQNPFGKKFYNGAPKAEGRFFPVAHLSEIQWKGQKAEQTGRLDPITFLTAIRDGVVIR
ncbi:MAG: hypothetical protein NDJ89_11375 [Oligoflexia bacterium]|nr:hypothetical protein [Oligoflexia bacterium]